MNQTLLSQTALDENNLHDVVKDARETVQFLQENAEPTSAAAGEGQKLKGSPHYFLYSVVILLLIFIVGLIFYIRSKN